MLRLEARGRRFVRWLRDAWDGSDSQPDAIAAAEVAGSMVDASSLVKGREEDMVRAEVRAEEHRENVWLAIGSLLILAGVGVMTAGWLHTAPATEVEPHPSTLFDRCETSIPFIVGGVVVLVGVLVLAAFFSERLAACLPPTTTENHRRKSITGDESQTRSVAQPKPAEAGQAAIPAEVRPPGAREA